MPQNATHGHAFGFHTNMAAEALNALRLLAAPVDEVSVLTSPGALGMASTLNAMRQARSPRTLMLTAESGLGPGGSSSNMSFAAPQHWACGADAVLIGIAADADLAGQRRAEVEQEWAKVFPGLSLPEGVL